jgi:hypothetical protein
LKKGGTKNGNTRAEGAMNRELKAGDRVRVVARNRLSEYYAGAKGTVRSGPHASASGTVYYLLAMDRDARRGTFLFTAHEVEPEQNYDSPERPMRNCSPEGMMWANQRDLF